MWAHNSGDDVIRWFGATRAMDPEGGTSERPRYDQRVVLQHTILFRHVAVPSVRIAAQDGARVPEPGDAGAKGAAKLAQTPELA